MTQLTKIGNSPNVPTKEFVCDTLDDVSSLPTCAMGSTALCLEDSSVWMRSGTNDSGTYKNGWVKL